MYVSTHPHAWIFSNNDLCYLWYLGDGMPDTDFHALDLKKKMKKFGIDEVCICEVGEYSNNSK